MCLELRARIVQATFVEQNPGEAERVSGKKELKGDIEAPSPPSVLQGADSSDMWTTSSQQSDDLSCASPAGSCNTPEKCLR